MPTRSIPDVVVRAGALVSPQLREAAAGLGCSRRTSNAAARQVLGWQPRPAREAIVAAARSMVTTG